MSQNLFPIHLLGCSEGQYMMIELKNGKTINGTLTQIDKFMNLRIENAVITSKEGDKFEKAPEFFIRGNSIKYIRLAESVLKKAINIKQNQKIKKKMNTGMNNK